MLGVVKVIPIPGIGGTLATAQMTPNQKSYQLSKPEIEYPVMEEMYAALHMCTCAEKTTFLGKYK